MSQVDIAQLAAHRSHNAKVVSSILTIHIIATALSVCVQLAVASTVVRAFNNNIFCSMPMIQMRKTHPKQNRDSNLGALGTHRKTTTTLIQYCFEAYCSLCIYPPASLLDPAIKTVWPSGVRRWLKAPFRKGVDLNPTAVILICHRVQIKTRQYESSTV